LFTSGTEVSFVSIVLHLLGGEGGGGAICWTSFQFFMSVDYLLKQEMIASAQKLIDWPTCWATAHSLNSISKSESESTADLSHSLKFKSISYLTKFIVCFKYY
jgi:hypothetical protein